MGGNGVESGCRPEICEAEEHQARMWGFGPHRPHGGLAFPVEGTLKRKGRDTRAAGTKEARTRPHWGDRGRGLSRVGGLGHLMSLEAGPGGSPVA